MTISLILDIFIILTLTITIVYAYKLHRQIIYLRNNKDQLGTLIEGFNSATLRAEKSIELLSKNAVNSGQNLQIHIDKSQSFRDEIMFLLDRGASLASRLEEDIQTARELKKKPKAFSEQSNITQPIKEIEKKSDHKFKSEVEKDLYHALKTMN